MSKWRASSLRNPGIKDLGHVLRRIPKLSAKGKRRDVEEVREAKKVDQRESMVL